MNLQTQQLASYLQERLKLSDQSKHYPVTTNGSISEPTSLSSPLLTNDNGDTNGNASPILANIVPRARMMEERLDEIISEFGLPTLEYIIEQAKARHESSNDERVVGSPQSTLENSEFSDQDVSGISIRSIRSPSDENSIFNYEGLFKDFLALTSQFIQIEYNPNAIVAEKAGVFMLWVFYDSFNLNSMFVPDMFTDSQFGHNHWNNIYAHYSTIEYLFSMEIINNEHLHRLSDASRPIFDFIGKDFLDRIFYRASVIKKAIADIENQMIRETEVDWFELYEKKVTTCISEDCSFEDIGGHFENAVDDYIPLCKKEAELAKNSSDKKLMSRYFNSEFVLQEKLLQQSRERQAKKSAEAENKESDSNEESTQSPEENCQQTSTSNKTVLNLADVPTSSLTNNLVGPSLHVDTTNNDSPKAPRTIETQNTNNVVDPNTETDAIENAFEKLSIELREFTEEYFSIQGDPFYMNFETLYNTIAQWIIDDYQDKALLTELNNLLGQSYSALIDKIVFFYKPQIRNAHWRNLHQKLPQNELVQSHSNNKTPSSMAVMKALNEARGMGGTKGPSIIIQTEKEKALKKDLRRQEKKINREIVRSQKNSNNLAANEIDGGEKLSIQDLERMRDATVKKTIKAAMEPKQQFLLAQAKPVVSYPHVFDMLQNVRQTASYIADTRLLLPDGCKRNDTRAYEEMTIPILSSSEATQEFLKNFERIKIGETDEFCKIGFEGFESLNLIQSNVFSTAYVADNQNMLICAPTGAGKTNIAMLTILNVLKNHSIDGTPNTIRRDQFKIVYIAPMKALCAEMAASFGSRLAKFGVKVRELTGDMQLTPKEIMETQMLVVTPEKWDIVTRKSLGDVQLLDLVRLIIIDEVHLLQSDRGHVLETLVARTVRYVERSQKFIRMVGLSATLPNYVDVAEFLRVDLNQGLFVFDERFRPVPLLKRFIGCKANNKNQMNKDMDEVTFCKAKEILLKENQVMVFVHSRNATMMMANFLLDRSQSTLDGFENVAYLFEADTSRLPGSDKIIARARYRNLNKFLLSGIGIHHAGMPRPERMIVEKLFKAGVIKVLICTSTLAWGVNLPAHSVIIRGTEYYDPAQGQFVDIDMLDVMQIFGRAGRPQYDVTGEATIITNHNKLAFYLSMLTNQMPIESSFLKRLTDNLNAEIVLGTVSNISEAVEWLRYTYCFIRMFKNPIEYGLKNTASLDQGIILDHLVSLARKSAEELDRAEMVRYTPDQEGQLDETHLGRIASHFYIQHETIVFFNETLRDTMDYGHIFDMLSRANEFHQLRCRDDEIEHLETMKSRCVYHLRAVELTNTHTKVNVLMQNSISRAFTDSHSLTSDLMYILQNVTRLTRGLFEFVIKKGKPTLAQKFLNLSLMFDKQIWDHDTPMIQFQADLPSEIMQKLIKFQQLSLYNLQTMPADEIGNLIRDKKNGSLVKRLAMMIPQMIIEATVKPITRTILTVYIDVKAEFSWEDKYHGKTAQTFWMWITDDLHEHMYHVESGRFTKKQVMTGEVQRFVFTIPLLDAQYLQHQYLVHSTFENWLGSESDLTVSCADLRLPEKYLPQTKLLDLYPLPVTALQNKIYQSIYNFTHFNPIQTQTFHTLYHTDFNVLLGAPTGSGKTIAAELALFRVFNTKPNSKVIYIAPMKALVRERVDDWKIKIERNMGRRVVELTGDVTPDISVINAADVIVTTPEKWDGVSRGWPSRQYVREVALIIIDEIHLLGEERGPVLEMIVSRANFICRRTKDNIRIVGLSTAVANAQDLATWLNIQRVGLYNFSSSVRPVPTEVHVMGFPGKHYCPRMASMNKPAFRAIKKYSPEKPVIIFVASRRQTRLTALDLIPLMAADFSTSSSFMRIPADELQTLLETVQDSHLKHTLSFGIGMHHAGLRESDRKLCEQLFADQKIRILITTATLAWGVNLPAHAVIIKGTEFFDGKKCRYADFPITDVLQMIGRAGRPQFDTSAVAVLFVHDIKKEYYKKFLYEPFPVESHLLEVFPDHLNAEIMSATVQTKSEAMEFLSSTYLYHRIIKNPSYYGVNLEGVDDSELAVNTAVIRFLSEFIDQCVQILVDHYCVHEVEQSNKNGDAVQQSLVSTPLGKICSYYYLTHPTIRIFQDSLGILGDQDVPYLDLASVLDLLTSATEYATLPVRHNEEFMNHALSKQCPISMSGKAMDSSHTKANLLIQAHCSRLKLPIVDFYTDLKSVLDQAIRILQAMIDISALNGSLGTTLNIISLQQSIMQASWPHTNQLLSFALESEQRGDEYADNTLNDATEFFNQAESHENRIIANISRVPADLCVVPYLLNVVHANPNRSMLSLRQLLSPHQISPSVIDRLHKALTHLPLINVEKLVLMEAADEASSVSDLKKFAVSKEESFKSLQDLNWLKLKPNSDYQLQCSLTKRRLAGGNKSRAYCPRFPKPKSESWYLVLGVPETSELMAIARVPNLQTKYSSQVTVQFRTPQTSSDEHRVLYSVYLLSDCYIGLDQQYSLPIAVSPNF